MVGERGVRQTDRQAKKREERGREGSETGRPTDRPAKKEENERGERKGIFAHQRLSPDVICLKRGKGFRFLNVLDSDFL